MDVAETQATRRCINTQKEDSLQRSQTLTLLKNCSVPRVSRSAAGKKHEECSQVDSLALSCKPRVRRLAEGYAMECGTREQRGPLFTGDTEQKFPLGAWLKVPVSSRCSVDYVVLSVARGSKPSDSEAHTQHTTHTHTHDATVSLALCSPTPCLSRCRAKFPMLRTPFAPRAAQLDSFGSA